jgi:hypothetical protein
MGAKAVDQTIPTLLEAMRNPGEASETALQALKEVMSVSTFLFSSLAAIHPALPPSCYTKNLYCRNLFCDSHSAQYARV